MVKQSAIDELNHSFGIDGKIRFEPGEGGQTKAVLSHAKSTAEVYIHGAHLTHFQPTGEKPVIFVSTLAQYRPGKAIRGGIPVIWPWFGAHPSDSSLPQHGFARKMEWDVDRSAALGDGRLSLTMRLIDTEETLALWPHPFRIEVTFLIGHACEISLTTENRSAEPITVTDALHTYFAVSDIHQISVEGLDGKRYLDKPQDFAEFVQSGPIEFDGEVDRVYLDAAGTVEIKDPQWKRIIRVHSDASASNSTVVWNPWIEKAAEMGDLGNEDYLSMVCVETANAFSDARVIRPGGTHTLTGTIDCTPYNEVN